MKNLALYGFAILFIAGLAACNNHSDKKQEDKKALPESQQKFYYKRLQSMTGKDMTVLHLIKYQSDERDKAAATTDRYSGTFIPKNGGTPMPVAGYLKADSSIQLIAYDHYDPVDTLVGSFEDGVFQGTKTDSSGQPGTFSFTETYPDGSYHWGLANFKDSLTVDTSARAPKATTDLMALWPGNDIDSAMRDRIKDTISLAFFGAKQTYANPETLLKAVSDSFLQTYKHETDGFLKQGGKLRPSFNWNLFSHMDITCNAFNRISLLYTQYQYTGGAHGLQSTFCLVVDIKKNKVLQLSDLFRPGYEKPLQQQLEAELRRQYNIPEGEPLNGQNGLLFDPELTISTNFYLTKDGIGFIYNPYAVAPYAAGEINLFLPFKRIKELLKE